MTVIFSCTLEQGKKRVDIIDQPQNDGADARYQSSAPGEAPTLEIDAAYSDLTTRTWVGSGQREWHGLTFRDGAYDYEIRVAPALPEDGKGLTGSITISRSKRVIADMACDSGSIDGDLLAYIEKIQASKARNID